MDTTLEQKQLTDDELDNLIVALVKERDHVSYVEIRDELAKYIEVDGDFAMETSGCRNLFLWAGMSRRFCEAVSRCKNGKRIFAHPASTPFVYIVDGVYPSLPLAKKPTREGYKTPHWTPVVFRLVPCM